MLTHGMCHLLLTTTGGFIVLLYLCLATQTLAHLIADYLYDPY